MFVGAFWRGIIGLFITGYFAVNVSSRLTNPNRGLVILQLGPVILPLISG